MAIGFIRIGKLAMATAGTIWTVMNVESLYTQTKHLLLPSSSSYPFLFFHVILLSILFQCSSFASRFTHLLLNLRLFSNSPQNSTATHQPPPLHQLSRGFSDIWSRIMDHKDDHRIPLDDQFAYSDHQPTAPIVEDDKEELGDDEVILEEEDGKNSMEETWKAIMEGKLKKCNTWDVTPSIDQMRGKPVELDSSKSFALEEENIGGKDCSNVVGGGGGGGQWGWRRMEVVLPRDEINQRAEEFINKIKNNIRLERLESYNLFLQLINRRTS